MINIVKCAFPILAFTLGLKSFSQTTSSTNDSTAVYLADPTVVNYKDGFYLYGTVSSKGFLVYTSRDLKSCKLSGKNGGYALMKGDAFGDLGFWAPQVFFYEGKWHMAYVANENIAIAESNSPLGPFAQTVKEPLQAPVKQIDPFVFVDDDGKVYLYHVRLTGGNKIFVAEMKDDLSAIKPETLKECITASDMWENTANATWPVTEGPSVIKHRDVYYLFYTANDYRNPDYAVGYATSASPLGPWTKYSGNPILSKKLIGISGTGHGDFFRKGEMLYYVFHTHNSADKVGPRRTAIIRINLKEHKNEQAQFEIIKNSFYYLTK